MPATSLYTCSFSFGSTLVIISAPLWSVWISQVATTWNSPLLESNGTARQCAWFKNESLNSWQDEWHFGRHKTDCTSLAYVPTFARSFSSITLPCKLLLLIMKRTSVALIAMTLLPYKCHQVSRCGLSGVLVSSIICIYIAMQYRITISKT